MIGRILSVTALLTSFAILCMGHGLQSVLVPARAALFEYYPNIITGVIMSAYYIGFVIGTLVCPALIGRVGHIRVFAASAACACAAILCHALVPQSLVWIILRVIYGFCFVHLYTVMESWLNSIGDTQSRGRILSIYMIINFLAMSSGQLLFSAESTESFELFSITAILLSLSLVPLALGRSVQPLEVKALKRMNIKRLFVVSPLGVIGAMTAGLMGGAYWGLTALFIVKIGFAPKVIAWFMAASLAGGLLAQWPLGALSDRINRRYVIIIASLLVCVTSTILSLMTLWSTPADVFGIGMLVLLAALFGAGFHPLYSLCIAHANDFIEHEHFVRASAGLQFTQSIGAIIGPLLAGVLMYVGGAAMLFIYIGALSGLLMLYTLQRMTENRIPLEKATAPFRMLTKTGLFAFLMDPRGKNNSSQKKSTE